VVEQMEFCVDALRELLADQKSDEHRASLVSSGMSRSILLDLPRSATMKNSHAGTETPRSLKMESPIISQS
jgi:hypothetical protein